MVRGFSQVRILPSDKDILIYQYAEKYIHDKYRVGEGM